MTDLIDTADIERMAREALDAETDARGRVTFSCDSYGLTRFAALVRAQALEDAARAVEAERLDDAPDNPGDEGYMNALAHAVSAIRALGDTK